MQLLPTPEVRLEKNTKFTKLNIPKGGFRRSLHWITAPFKSRTCLRWSVIGICVIGIHAEDLGGHRLNEFGRCWRRLVGRQSAWQKESCGAFTWLEKKDGSPEGHLDKKHLLFEQTQICFPLESVEMWSKSCFERDAVHLYILIIFQHENTENMRSVIITQPSSHRHTDFWL